MRLVVSILLAVWGGVALALETSPRPMSKPAYEAVVLPEGVESIRPIAREPNVPRTRWGHLQGTDLWTRLILSSLEGHGKPILQTMPRDIARWCPGYESQSPEARKAFWAGLISTLAYHESTWRPTAVGDNGKSFGLLQIRPATASHFKCRVRSGAALKDPTDNLSCAIRIMAKTVTRDKVVSHQASGRRGGPGRDWGPFAQAAKREDMRRWVRAQPYCQPYVKTRPVLRPESPAQMMARTRPVMRTEELVGRSVPSF
ncbi:MAG: transglycosylase SLT domain-containing protein [Shimia sp.]